MAYQVTFTKLAILNDGSVGNVSQGVDVCYTDISIGLIPERLETFLKDKKKQFPVITEIKEVKGFTL